MQIRNYKTKALDIIDRLEIAQKRKGEIKKYKDPRRMSIYSQTELSFEQKQAIDELYIGNYGRKIPYTWHQHFTAFTGNFDKNYFPELLFIPEFEHFMNLKKENCIALADKSITGLLAKALEIDSPKIIVSATGGIFRDERFQQIDVSQVISILSEIGEVFCKPSIDSSSGMGCRVVDLKAGKDKISGKSIETILNELGKDFLIQEKIQCHEKVKALHPNSVNTFRVMTYRWKDGIRVLPVIMRIGQGKSFLDNAHAGGMFIAINNDGQLHKTAFTEFHESFEVHPDSKIIFKDHIIPFVPQVIETAKRLHMAYPDIGVISWDFTIGRNGSPILIEANLMYQSVWLPEIAHGCGAFREDTAEILRWMKTMKSLKKSERYKIRYGYNFE